MITSRSRVGANTAKGGDGEKKMEREKEGEEKTIFWDSQ